ncbi:MAG: DUF1338 domain-containing protein [Planctomycetaceae bacterium]
MTSKYSPGPHSRISLSDDRERFAAALFDRLWERYRTRVSHVGVYERVIRDAGATFVNDHIAFRTFAWQRPFAGIGSVSRIFEALGYVPAGCYHFADKHLSAIHFQHPNGEFPKLFISESKTWELSESTREIIGRSLAAHREPVLLEMLARLADANLSPNDDSLLAQAAAVIQERPWPAPEKADVETLNNESQYAAWVLVHGYEVNHFTSLINSHGVAALDDIEKTIAALQQAGVPMKAEIEGERGSKLRQSATEAAVIDVAVRENGRETTTPWTYAYFELAERGEITDGETGRRGRFEGFLGPQATNLFEMTRVRGK